MKIEVDWEEVFSRGVVRKTVALHPIWEQYVRNTWTMLIQKGYDVSYSSVVNYMIGIAVLSVTHLGIDEETAKIMGNFLRDRSAIAEIDHEEALAKFREALRKGGR